MIVVLITKEFNYFPDGPFIYTQNFKALELILKHNNHTINFPKNVKNEKIKVAKM